jgi:hypothetical protein
MDTSTALELRMRSLLLRGGFDSVAGIVEWFGAMQAQDVNSGLWSFGVRLPGAKLEDITAALERREAIRTWPMRGTVHWVPPADARWMLDLMGVRTLAGAERRRRQLGLSAADAEKAVELLGSALAGGGRMTRAECLRTLGEGGIAVGGQMGYHLLWYASQRAVTAIAPHTSEKNRRSCSSTSGRPWPTGPTATRPWGSSRGAISGVTGRRRGRTSRAGPG